MTKRSVSFVVGPEKTATTYIQMLLEQHPDATLPQGIKETFFFDKFYDNGLDWYLKRFDLSETRKCMIEVAPSYFSEKSAIKRIQSAFPNARIVICTRDVVERTISHHAHMRRYGYINTPLMESLNQNSHPLRSSLYSRYCPLWEKAFGSENITIVDMQVLKNDPETFAEQVFEGVGLSAIHIADDTLSITTNQAAIPRNYVVAKAATMVSNQFKQLGLYKALEVARNSPLHSLVFGSQQTKSDNNVDPASRIKLYQLLAKEYAFLKQKYGISYPQMDLEEDTELNES